MEADIGKIVVSLITLAVFVGVLSMVVRNPVASNTLLGAGASGYAGVIADLEGRPVTA